MSWLKQNWFKVIITLIIIFQLWLIFSLRKELKELECDLASAFFAEREYTYPILRNLGYEPENYGEGVDNLLTTEAKYNEHCL